MVKCAPIYIYALPFRKWKWNVKTSKAARKQLDKIGIINNRSAQIFFYVSTCLQQQWGIHFFLLIISMFCQGPANNWWKRSFFCIIAHFMYLDWKIQTSKYLVFKKYFFSSEDFERNKFYSNCRPDSRCIRISKVWTSEQSDLLF